MIPKIQFIRPHDLEEVLLLLGQYKKNAGVIAGGTDVVPAFQIDSVRYKDITVLVDIRCLDQLKGIEKIGDGLMIGAAATFTQLSTDALIKSHAPVLATAALAVGSHQIRNMATVGGNIVNNAPCADSVPALLVYNAVLHIQSQSTKKKIHLADFLVQPYTTQLEPGEIITAIQLPIPPDSYKGDFYKLGRRRGAAISRISLALLADIHNGVIRDIRIASGAVTPIGKRFRLIETRAKGKEADTDLFKSMAKEMGREIMDITGLRWSSPYKLPVVQQAFYQLLEKVCRLNTQGEEGGE